MGFQATYLLLNINIAQMKLTSKPTSTYARTDPPPVIKKLKNKIIETAREPIMIFFSI